MPNFIVIMFNLLYPMLYVGFYCKGCVWERVWRLKAKWRAKKFSRVAREKHSQKVKHVLSTWLECEELWQMVTVGFRECLAGKAFPRDTHETFYFVQFVTSDTPYPYPHYIYLHYPHMLKSVFQRENPSTLES